MKSFILPHGRAALLVNGLLPLPLSLPQAGVAGHLIEQHGTGIWNG